jgi:hypothetical protein
MVFPMSTRMSSDVHPVYPDLVVPDLEVHPILQVHRDVYPDARVFRRATKPFRELRVDVGTWGTLKLGG